MNDKPKSENGKICYVEIPADSVDVSAAFYREVFGWSIRTRGDGRIAFDDGIGGVSGTWVTGRKASTEPGLIFSIMVDSVTETVELLKTNGGKVVKEIQMGGDEVIVWFTDPAGNVISLYQHPGGGNGKICYLEIPAKDINKSADFYGKVFPWGIRKDNAENISFDDGIGLVSGMWTTELSTVDSGLIVYIMVDDVATTINAITLAGGVITQPVGMDLPSITARFSDPAGNILGLYQQPE